MRLPKQRRLALLLSVMLPLTACAQLTSLIPSAETDLPAEVDPAKVACEAFEPLTYSSKDTPETQRGIIGFNAAWCAVCPGKDARCPKPGA